jgi:hypothetical protein
VPDKYRKGIESKCFKFIWDGKPDKVKRNTMIGNFEMGGLNMIDIGSYFASLQNVIAFLFDPHPSLSRFAIFLYKNQEYILNNL